MPQVTVSEEHGHVRIAVVPGHSMILDSREARSRANALARFADLALDHDLTVQPQEAGLIGPEMPPTDAYALAATIFHVAANIDFCRFAPVQLVEETALCRVADGQEAMTVRV